RRARRPAAASGVPRRRVAARGLGRGDGLRLARRGPGRPDQGRARRPEAAQGDLAGRSRPGRVVAVEAVVFDLGETLVDETALWESAADAAGIPRFTLMGVLGGLAARGEPHARVWEILGVEPPRSSWPGDGFDPDALPALARLRSRGLAVGAVGNTPIEAEELVRPHVDFVGSSARWGVHKPAAEFFARVAAEAEHESSAIAYVGDRVDN